MKKAGFYFVNGLTWYRLLAAPVLLILVFAGYEHIFKWMLPLSFFTDLVDGFLARKFRVSSKTGSFLDSIADDLTIISGIAGLVVFKWWFVKQELVWICILFSLFLVQMIMSLIRYKKISSFHTYAAKVSAILQGCFLILVFLLPAPVYGLWYSALAITAAELLEEIILVLLLPVWETDVKGLYRVIKKSKKNSLRRNEPGV